MSSAKQVLTITGVFGILAVIIGAFGAHGLEDILVENDRLETFETGVRYHFYHTLSLLVLGLLMARNNHQHFRNAAVAFSLGIVIFSGSLYTLSLTNIGVLGAITPIGGVGFILGWIFLILGARKTFGES